MMFFSFGRSRTYMCGRAIFWGQSAAATNSSSRTSFQADYIIEMGLGGGTDGGEVVFTGTPEQMLQCAASRTGAWLES